MPTWIKVELQRKQYRDPRNGKVLTSINGRKNDPYRDPFTGGGKVYPKKITDLKWTHWQQRGTTLLLLVDDLDSTVNDAINGLSASKQRPEDVLPELKKIGLPEGTTLDANMKPVIPEENTK